jgi:peptide chain release factor 1
MTHLPTGITEYREGRNRVDNRRNAYQGLLDRLDQMASAHLENTMSVDRRTQAGSGMRGDKIRTIRFQDDSAIDHTTGKRMKATQYMNGKMDSLWATVSEDTSPAG